jgi:hypothetical protein
MPDPGWLPVAGTGVGAVIALAGTLVASVRTDRSQRRRDRETDRLRSYVDFALALDAAHSTLRDVARTTRGPDRFAAAVHGVGESGLYGVRERLLMSGSTHLVATAEVAFARLIGIRNVVRAGAALSSPEYHDAYHAFSEALWGFRIAARRELGQSLLTPAEMDRTSWSEREQCPVCDPHVAAP